MARRNKRASMREGPLSDLFRGTGADAPEDPPEAPAPREHEDDEDAVDQVWTDRRAHV